MLFFIKLFLIILKYYGTYRPIHASTSSPTRSRARVLCNRGAYFQSLAGKPPECPSLRERDGDRD